jgi:GH24 family phage-related lysozyme (muramidase)
MAEEKFTNIIGVPFKEYVSKQLDIRAKNISTIIDRTNDNILFLANKNCWIKLTSFVTVENGYAGNLNGSTPIGTFLAENWTLFGGTSYLNKNTNPPTNNLRFGIEQNTISSNDLGANNPKVLSITNSSAYGLGGLSQQGYKVMPGIQSAKIQHMGTAGSLRSATINLYVGNKQQLDIIDMLYFRLGYSCLLEWGHTSYLDNNGNIQSNNIYPIDIFDVNSISSKEDVLLKISEKKRAYQGNYDAMYGAVSNYEWNMNVNGGYDCNLKLMGLGSVIDSLKINQSFSLTDGGYEGNAQNKTDGTTQTKGLPPATPIVPKDPKIVGDKYISYPNGQFWNLDGSQFPNINYEKLIGIQSKCSFNFSYVTTNQDRPLIGSTDGANILNKNTPNNKKLLIKKDGNKYSAYNPESTTNESVNTLTNIDFVNTKPTDPKYKDTAFKIQLLPEQKGISKTVRLSRDIPLQEKTKNFYELKPFEEIKEKGFLDTLKDVFKAGARQRFNDLVNLFTTGDLSFFNVPGEVINSVSSIFAKQIISKSIRITYDIPYDTFAKNLDIIYEPYATVSNNLKQQDPQDADKITLPALQIFYSTFLASVQDINNKIKNPTKSFELKGKDDKIYVLTITLNDYKPVSKGTTLDLIVNISITNTNLAPKTLILQKLKEFLKEIYGQFENTGVTNKALYTKTSLVDSNKFVLNDYGAQNIKKDYSIGRVVYTYDENKFNNAPNIDTEAPTTDLTIPESTLPRTATNNIDKFLIELRDEAVARGTEGKIDLYDFITNKLKTGALDSIRTETENEPSPKNKSEIPTDPKKRLGYRIRKGFNTEIMAENRDDVDKIPDVDFRELFTAYNPGLYDDASQGETSYYIYIKLGFLLYYINNNSLLYEKNAISTEETALKKPYLYIDFNPKTNFCLTTKFHFSVDPSVCLIPVNISREGYDKLFPNIQIVNNKFSKDVDVVSKFINTGFSDKTEIDESRGNIMNIGVNIDFIINTLSAQQNQNEKSNSYLRPFLETILAEINKSLGNLNNFRVGYDDEGNTVRIYDDQYVNPPSGQTTISTNYTKTGIVAIPIFGKNSIARNITLKTGVSTAMSNQIAISSQAGNLGELNVDASSFGNINKNLIDRLMPVKEVASKPKIGAEPSTADKSSAEIFNNHIYSIYNEQRNNKINANIAKNYYSTVANKLKADTPSTSIKPVLPLELNVTMDGISGISLLEGFIIPTDLLPMQYLTSGLSKVGFAVMGLDQSIEGNQWTTTIKGQMINLPDPTKKLSNELGAADIGTAQGSRQTSNNISSEPTDIGNINLSGGYLQITYNILKTEEGFREKAYWDVNAYRVGYGNDKFIDKDNKLKSVQSNTVITEEQGSKTLIYTVKNNFEPGVIKQIGKENWDLLNNNQKAALLSYAYNAGAGALSKWNISQEIKSKNYKAAANNIARGPITGGGKVYDVLIKRRKKESTIFLS